MHNYYCAAPSDKNAGIIAFRSVITESWGVAVKGSKGGCHHGLLFTEFTDASMP